MYRFPTHLNSQVLVAQINWRVLGHLSWPLGLSSVIARWEHINSHRHTAPQGWADMLLDQLPSFMSRLTQQAPCMTPFGVSVLKHSHTPFIPLSPSWWRAKAYLFPLGFRLLDTADRTFQQLAFCIDFHRFKPKIHWMSLRWQLPLPGSSSIRSG